VLVDTGNPGGRDPQRIHRVATEMAGLKSIDHVVITHFHGDHFGGLAELAALLPIGAIYDKGVPEGSPDGKPQDARWALMKRPYLDAKAGRRVTLAAGDEVPLKQAEGSPKIVLRCLGANQTFISPPAGAPANPLNGSVPPKAPDPTDNANSVVLLLEFGGDVKPPADSAASVIWDWVVAGLLKVVTNQLATAGLIFSGSRSAATNIS